jgi:hypothetical protein
MYLGFIRTVREAATRQEKMCVRVTTGRENFWGLKKFSACSTAFFSYVQIVYFNANLKPLEGTSIQFQFPIKVTKEGFELFSCLAVTNVLTVVTLAPRIWQRSSAPLYL